MVSSNRYRLIASVGLFVIVFAAYCSLVSDWGFNADDYAAVHMGKNTRSYDVLTFFSDNPNEYGASPSNIRAAMSRGFFDVSFRPLTMALIYALETRLLGTENAYRYFCVSAGLHALSVAVAFFIFSMLVPWWLALSGALFFAFHASLGLWFGALSEQTFILGALLLMLAGYLLSTGLALGSRWRYLISIGLAGVSLFLHEFALGFPVWAVLIIFIYFRSLGSVDWIKRSALYMVPFVVVLFLYFVGRLLVYPIGLGGAVFNPNSIWSLLLIKVRCFDYVTLLVDLIGLAWLPAGHRMVKSLVLIAAVVGTIVLWWRSRCRSEVALIALGVVLLGWPSFILMHKGRYIYAALPWLIAAVILCARGTRNYLLSTTLCCLSIFGFVHNKQLISQRATTLRFVRSHFDAVARVYQYCRRPICFLGVPSLWFDEHGTAQALWLRWKRDEPPVYIDARLCSRTSADNHLAPLPHGKLVTVLRFGDTITFRTLDHDQIWFPADDGQTSLGWKETGAVVTTPFGQRAYAFAISLDQQWLQRNPVILTWDFAHDCFMELVATGPEEV